MTRFLDGPAAGQLLMLKRAPVFLRVVQDRGGKWDALDQLSDTPQPGETVTIYRKVFGSGGSAFVDGRDLKTGKRWGGLFQSGDYRVVAEQPAAEVTRDTAKWQEWCEAEVAKIIESKEPT